MDPDKSGEICASVAAPFREEKSPVKKPRTEDSNGETNDYSAEVEQSPYEECDIEMDEYSEELEDFNSSDEDGPFGRDFTEEEFAKYTEQLNQSGGYDVDYFPDVSEMGIIVPLIGFKEDPSWYNDAKQYSILAIEKYNEEMSTDYEFLDVEKINIQGGKGFTCWITFTVKDLEDPHPNAEPKAFQAQVYGGINEVIVDKVHPKEA